jgi:glycine/D-amino acid oxidase-like deaminating enzyme
MRVVIVGGGIAGLAAGFGLVRAGIRDITLLEREEQLFAHSSGRNAAIYRPAEKPLPVALLAARSAELLDELTGSRAAWLAENGVLLTSPDPAPLEVLGAICLEARIAHERLDHTELVRRAPIVESGHARIGLWLPEAGVLDIHAIEIALARELRARGGTIELAAPVRRLVREGDRITAVELDDGSRREADAVVIAGGAWASMLGETCAAPLELTPIRRHLVMLDPPEPVPAHAPTIWDAVLESYFRPESKSVLASPGDAVPWHPELPAPDPSALETLWEKLRLMAPSLASSRVRRSWACLRTFAKDRVSIAGADPRVSGLFWLAGLGGHGLTAGVAAGEVLGEVLAGKDHPLAAAVSPGRLFG